MKFQRRDVLKGSAAGLLSVPFPLRTSAVSEPDFDHIGQEALDGLGRLLEALANIAGNPKEALVASANEIGPVYEPVDSQLDDYGLPRIHNIGETHALSEVGYEAFKKTLNVCREYFGLKVPWLNIIGAFGKWSSIGGILMGASAVGQAAYKLHKVNTFQGVAPAKIQGELYEDYVLSIVGLIIEMAFIWVPISFRPAWRGTRFVANRTLLRVRRYLPGKVGNALIAISMSIIHWVQRGVIDYTLTSLASVADIVQNLGNIVERQTQDIRRDCTLNIEDSLGSFHLLDVDLQVLTDAFSRLIEETSIALESLLQLFGEETIRTLDLLSE
jgi:hypothetical protein